MNVAIIASSLAKTAATGPAPSVDANARTIATIGVATTVTTSPSSSASNGAKTAQAQLGVKTVIPAVSRADAAAMWQSTLYLGSIMRGPQEGSGDLGAPQTAAATSSSSSKRSSSGRSKSSRGGASSSSTTSATASMAKVGLGMAGASMTQAVLSVVAFRGMQGVAMAMTSDVLPALYASLKAALLKSGANTANDAQSIACAKVLRHTAQVVGSLLGVLAIEGRALVPLTKALERDMRRRLIHKHVKETYFGRTAMHQALSYSPNDVYEGLKSSINRWATDTSTAAALLCKVVSQLLVCIGAGVAHMGAIPTLRFTSLLAVGYVAPLLIAGVGNTATAASSSGGEKGASPLSSGAVERTNSNASSTKSALRAAAKSSAAQQVSSSKSRAHNKEGASTTPKDRASSTKGHADEPKEVTLRYRLYTVVCGLLRALAVLDSMRITTTRVLAASPSTATASSPFRAAVGLLFAAARDASGGKRVSTPDGSFAATVAAPAAGQWAYTSLLLSNICLLMASLLRTVYGNIRTAGRGSIEIARREKALHALHARVLKLGTTAGGGGSSKHLALTAGENIEFRSVDIRKDPSTAPKASSSSSSSSKHGRRSSSSSSSDVIVKGLSFGIAAGNDLLICCNNGAVRTTILQLVGQYHPLYQSSSSSADAPNKGTTRIVCPSPDAMLYLPKCPFYPRLSTLKQQVLFPRLTAAPTMGENGLLELFELVGLGGLFDREDDVTPQDWDTPSEALDRKLTPAEKQRIGLARALYHKPRFLFIDDGLSVLTHAEVKAFYELCHARCITVVTTANRDAAAMTANVPHHKTLLQIDEATGAYVFGSLVGGAASPPSLSGTPMKGSRASVSLSSAPAVTAPSSVGPTATLRVLTSSDATQVGRMLSFDATKGCYAAEE